MLLSERSALPTIGRKPVRNDSVRRLLVCAGLTLVLAGIASTAAPAQTTTPLSAMIPKDSEISGGVRADWVWNTTASIRKSPKVAAAIAKAEATTGFSIENDILPWAGQISVAGVHMGTPDQKVLAYIEVRDMTKFLSLLGAIREKAAANPNFKAASRDYDGQTIFDLGLANAGAKAPPVEAAVLPGWVVLGLGKGSAELALDVAGHKAPSLDSDPAWSQTMSHLPKEPTMWFACKPEEIMKSTGASKAMPAEMKNSMAMAATQCAVAFALTDQGTGARVDVVASPTSPAAKKFYAQWGKNLPPLTGKVLQKVPDAVFAVSMSNPAYLVHWAETATAQFAPNGQMKQQMDMAVKQMAPINQNVQYFHKDAGIAITWRADRGFGLVLLAQADSHAAALHVAKTLANGLRKMGAPLTQGGSSWSVPFPAAALGIPSTVPLKLAPYFSAKDDWLMIGSHPMWTSATSATPKLQAPAEAAGSPQLSMMSMRWLPSLLAFIEKQPGMDEGESKQGIAIVRGLKLEESEWASWSHIDPTGSYAQFTGQVTGWDWHTAIENTVQGIRNWKPTPKPKVEPKPAPDFKNQPQIGI